MKISELSIPGGFLIETQQHPDDRGAFLEWFSAPVFEEAVGESLELRQANMSVSAAGVIRGIHYADVPPGQAKYVTCVYGAVLDIVVDIRQGSATFGQWCAVELDDRNRNAVYLKEGLGHAFMALSDGATVAYLCTSGYNPTAEHGINPLDPELAIAWPTVGGDGRALPPILSPKDAAAPTLAEARDLGVLPILR